MVKCEKCGRENDDSFKFCLDCGNQLHPSDDEEAPATAPTMADTPEAPAEEAPAEEAPAEATPAEEAPAEAAPVAAPEAPAASETQPCPQCNAPVKTGDVFCSSCGQRMGEEPNKGQTMYMHVASPDAVQQPKARLVLIKPDGSEGTVFTLAEKTVIGRSQGMIMFPKDAYVSPKHAELVFQEGQLSVNDLGSLNGVYIRMNEDNRIHPGTYFRIGRQMLRLEAPSEFQSLNITIPEGDDSTFWGSPPPRIWARLVQVLEGGKIGEIHLLSKAEVMIGREQGEVRFPDDGFVSSRHCLVLNKDGECYLRDLGSSNGTYMKIRDNQPLQQDDRIQIGNQVLKVDIST